MGRLLLQLLQYANTALSSCVMVSGCSSNGNGWLLNLNLVSQQSQQCVLTGDAVDLLHVLIDRVIRGTHTHTCNAIMVIHIIICMQGAAFNMKLQLLRCGAELMPCCS